LFELLIEVEVELAEPLMPFVTGPLVAGEEVG
jgi:hypothetical protein